MSSITGYTINFDLLFLSNLQPLSKLFKTNKYFFTFFITNLLDKFPV